MLNRRGPGPGPGPVLSLPEIQGEYKTDWKQQHSDSTDLCEGASGLEPDDFQNLSETSLSKEDRICFSRDKPNCGKMPYPLQVSQLGQLSLSSFRGRTMSSRHVYRCVLWWRHLVKAYGVISLVQLIAAT